MSSTAAVQASAPYQNPPASRDQYYQQPAAATSSSSTARRTARPSNGTSPRTPTQPSPAESSSSTITPGAATLPPSTNNSPAVAMSSAGPPIPPPRTSSNQRSNSGTPDNRSAASATRSASGYIKEGEAAAAQARRRGHPSPKDNTTQSPRTTTRAQPPPGHSRSFTAIGQPPIGTDLPREDSTIINRLVITDPQVDIAREQERLAESRPVYADGNSTPRSAGHTAVNPDNMEDSARSTRTRQEKSGRTKEMKFGEYILGQTLGEGEFGKVKMGWKRDGGVQVAIKLIRRDTLGTNPSRLPKIYREIAILRGLQHPNIVRLHEMVETERHIGIILEYASGGELFDYILQHRFLKDNSARRLFAQLVSGVGYLHKKGIVHRDLKLENLLLDRNRNIIITDFGFANTFNPGDELGEEMEYNLANKDFVRKMGLDHVHEDGHRRGDLMQTSCGSPCYAAPELVVSDSLYTGRKVDVWSCGVILYAMLAGYLPFDDDPANPEGDNINLLYKYIVSTPLTFPEYVTPHARDLLKRILVPDPRQRADLFEVARHSWLSEYAHVVAFITSSTTSPSDISNTTVPAEDIHEPPHLARSASVREPTKSHNTVAAIGGLQKQPGGQLDQNEKAKTSRDNKRRTVQVEYVAPSSSTTRGAEPAKTRARGDGQGPVEVADANAYGNIQRPAQRDQASPTNMPPPQARPVREQPRAASEYIPPGSIPLPTTRPNTKGSMTGARLPSRDNSYGQPAVGVAKEQAQGRFSQPRGKQYTMTSDFQDSDIDLRADDVKRSRAHKRSSTLSELFGKRGSIFGMNRDKADSPKMEKPPRSHPPVSMKQPIPSDGQEPRRSTDSRRTSFSFGRKNPSSDSSNRSSRRFSFIPSSLTNSFGGSSRNSQAGPPDTANSEYSRHNREGSRGPKMTFGRGESRSPSRSTTASGLPVTADTAYDTVQRERDSPRQRTAPSFHGSADAGSNAQHNRLPSQHQQGYDDESSNEMHFADPSTDESNYYRTVSGGTSTAMQQDEYGRFRPLYPSGFNSEDQEETGMPPPHAASRKEKHVLQKPHRNFPDGEGHQGGKAKRVMDFFRMRGKARSGE